MDIVASSIISTYDVDNLEYYPKDTLISHFSLSFFTKWTLHHGRDCLAKTGDGRLMPHFWWKVFAHFLPEILTKHNIKETSSKGNIWGPFHLPKGEGPGGG